MCHLHIGSPPKASRPEKGDQRQVCAPTCNIASLSRASQTRDRQTDRRPPSPDARSLAGRLLPDGEVGIRQRHGETSRRSALECSRPPQVTICLSTQRAKGRGPRPEASWLTLLFSSFFFGSVSHAPSHRSIHRIGRAQGKGIYYCGLQFIPRVLKGPPSSYPRPRHGSTSLPKCGSDPLEPPAFLALCPFFLSICLFFFPPPLQPLVGASVGNFAYLAPPGFNARPCVPPGVSFLPKPI